MAPPAPKKQPFWSWFTRLFSRGAAVKREPSREQSLGAQEARVLSEFCRQYGVPFRDLTLLKLALTHRSYLSVTGQGPRESNERLEFLGDSVLGLVTSENLYRRHPDEHEGQLTKIKSLLVSKAILSRRALRMGLGRFVLMSHSEVESGGRQRLSILADAFESVIGAIYLDQGFEASRAFITHHLLDEADAITSDKRHTNYKSHLQEYVQNAFRTHPVYRIRSEYGPDHSKHFMVEVMVGKRTLGEGRGHNKKEAEQAAARDALEKVERVRRKVRDDDDRDDDDVLPEPDRAERPDRDGRDGRRRREEPQASRGPERDRDGRRRRDEGEAPREDDVRRGRGGRVPPGVSAAAPEPVDDDEEEREESGEEASPVGRRRRRSRRGGRGRHAGARDEGAPPLGDDEPDEPVTMREVARPGNDDDDDERDDRDEHVRARRDHDDDERDDEDPLESPARQREPEPAPARTASPAIEEFAPPPARPVPAAPSGPVSFGRGRRRVPAPAPAPAPPSDPEAAEARRVDPFGAEEPPVAELPPVVDVVPPEPVEEEETEVEREARIEEMERALESFGKRRPPDYGRRGRRR